MLLIKPNCEHCRKALPNESTEAMICSFECTFCRNCVKTVLQNVCPNCGGGLEKRPVRPTEKLDKYPASTLIHHQAIDMEAFATLLQRCQSIQPHNR